MLTALTHSNTVLAWCGYGLAALILAGVLTLAGLLVWRDVRDWLFRDADSLVPELPDTAWDDVPPWMRMTDERKTADKAMLAEAARPTSTEDPYRWTRSPAQVEPIIPASAWDACAADDAALSLDPDQGRRTADGINWGPGDRTDLADRIPWQRKGGES